ncbi:hypothetical protein RUND412_008843 [Rhizina undulata]
MATPYNSSFVQYDGQFFNQTLLNEFNYTIYSNGTLSNASNCFLLFDTYMPVLIENGTVYNGTSCYSPIDPIRARAILGIVFGVLFGTIIVLGITSLRKHGLSYLPVEKKFKLVSRRWQWYWLVTSAACGLISGLMAIDVDRDYLQSTALILQSIFYYVTLPATLAAVWEMTRHWGSFLERQMVDEDAFIFSQEDTRSKIEFYMPLVFYLFAFLNFFLSILRSWTPISKGSSSSATDPRFRVSAIFAVIAYFIIIASTLSSMHYYRPLSRSVPWKITLSLIFIFIRVVYNVACAWEYTISPLSNTTSPAYIYALGYLPIILVMFTMILAAWREPNEDLKIKQLRREREFNITMEMNKAAELKKASDVPKAAV